MKRKSSIIIFYCSITLPSIVYLLSCSDLIKTTVDIGKIGSYATISIFVGVVIWATAMISISKAGTLSQTIARGTKFKCIKQVSLTSFVIETEEQKPNESLFVKAETNEMVEGKRYIKTRKGIQEFSI